MGGVRATLTQPTRAWTGQWLGAARQAPLPGAAQRFGKQLFNLQWNAGQYSLAGSTGPRRLRADICMAAELWQPAFVGLPIGFRPGGPFFLHVRCVKIQST